MLLLLLLSSELGSAVNLFHVVYSVTEMVSWTASRDENNISDQIYKNENMIGILSTSYKGLRAEGFSPYHNGSEL